MSLLYLAACGNCDFVPCYVALCSLCLDYCVLASTFDVLTWRVMPDAGEAAPEELIVPYFAN